MNDTQASAGTFQLSDYLTIIFRHKLLVSLTTVLAVAGVFAYSFSIEPTFRAEARLLLEESSAATGILGELASISQAPPAAAEIEVIRSRKLANAVVAPPDAADIPEWAAGLGLGLTTVIDDLDRYWPASTLRRRLLGGSNPRGSLVVRLDGEPDYSAPQEITVKFIADDQIELVMGGMLNRKAERFSLIPGEPIRYLNQDLYFEPSEGLQGRTFRLQWQNRRTITESLISRLGVSETQRGSGVLRVSYSDTDPHRAANVVNTLARVYIAYNRDRLTRNASATVTFIEAEVDRIKAELEDAEAELVNFQEESGAAMLTEAGVALVEKMSDLDLERARLSLEIEAQQQLVDAVTAPDVSADQIASIAGLDASTAAMAKLLSSYIVEEQALALEFTDAWPPLIEVRQRIEQTRNQIREGLLAHVDALQRKDESLERSLGRYEEDLGALPRSERELAKFQRRATAFAEIYSLLLTQLQQAKILEAAAVEQVDVLDWAVPPRARLLPDVRLNGLIGILIGMTVGIVLSVFRESSSRRVFTAAQLEGVTGLTQFGVIPDFRKGPAKSRKGKSKHFLALRDDPDSSAAEAYRALRANLKFAAKGKKIRTMTITSAGQGEGKSTTTTDLAIALAQGGSQVLLVDADLRRPVLHKYFQKPVKPGLSETLRDGMPWQETVQPSGIQNLSWIPAGSSVRNPGDILASDTMTELVNKMSEEYDYVLFDVPPVLAVADAAAFLHELDAIFLLCRANFMPEGVVMSATRRLQLVGAPVIGTILNSHRPSRMSSDYSSYGYGYGYGYDNKGAERDAFE